MALEFEQILEAYKEQYPPTLNTSQVADMLGSTAEVVRSKVSTGEIPAYRWGKNFRYFRDEVLDWLRQQAVSHDGARSAHGTSSVEKRASI